MEVSLKSGTRGHTNGYKQECSLQASMRREKLLQPMTGNIRERRKAGQSHAQSLATTKQALNWHRQSRSVTENRF